MIQPVKIPLTVGADSEVELRKFLRDKIRALREGLRPIYQTRLVAWRQAYEAKPYQGSRSFPFENASNLVVPIIAIHSDTLLARVMSAIVKTRPVWVVKILGDLMATQMGEARTILEEFLEYVAFEPTELNLYPVYNEFFGEAIRYGTSTLKCPMVNITEEVAIPSAGDGMRWADKVVYAGPRPEKIPFQDFLIDPMDKNIETSSFYGHVIHLKKFQLEERAFKSIYDKKAVDKVLKQPDRTSPSTINQQKQTDAGVSQSAGYGFEEWDIYECHFKYNWGGHYTRCIVWYHERSDTVLRAFFNYYPAPIFISSRLFYRDDMYHGYGFAEILGEFQEEISQIHNGRRDNVTVSNTMVWRVNSDSKLHKGYRVYPGAMLPADVNEIEALQAGQVSPMTIDEERLSLDLAERRSGVAPPMQGMGAGTNTKRGVYTAMGTLSLLQEGNTRTDLNVTDMRHSATKLGRLLCQLYGEFGVDDRARYFGKKGQLLEGALKLYQTGRLAIPITAATASVNREIEKQNDLLLSNIARQHYTAIAGVLAQMQNPGLQPQTQQYLQEAMLASNTLMKIVFRHFGMDEIDRLVPNIPGQDQGNQPPDPAQMGGGMQPPQPGQLPTSDIEQPINGPQLPVGAPALMGGKLQ